jgi:thioredoxin-related protein
MNKSVLLGGAAALVIAAAGYFLISGSSNSPTTEPVAHVAENTDSHADVGTEAQAKPQIDWYDGTVDEAFALAKAEGKPVLLYWGAVWCPPCAQLKATIFKRADFIEKTDLFVTVYLDGDTERAQSYGEKFSVRGYPTLIIFNPEAEEVTRIPGGMNLERYVDVLDLALNDIQPASTLLASIMDDGYTPSEQELSLLAHYSWGQDAGKALGEREAKDVFQRLTEITPIEMAEIKSRFEAEYLDQFSGTPSEEDEPLSDEVKADIVTRTAALLDDHALSRANLYFVPYSMSGIIKNTTEEGSDERQAIVASWQNRLTALSSDTSLNTAERLRLFAGEIRVAKLSSEEVPEELKESIRTAIATERENSVDSYEDIVITNASFGLLLSSDQNELAGEMLRKELESSDTGYYWMVDLAYLAEEAGQTEEAISWLKKAYDDADGLATRAQWGSYYVDGLTTMAGNDIPLIEATVSGIFAEFEAQSGYMHARNMGALKRIGRSLNAWVDGDKPETTEEGEAETETETEVVVEPVPERLEVRQRLVDRFEAMCTAEVQGDEELEECFKVMHKADA